MNNDQTKMSDWLKDCMSKGGIWVEKKKREKKKRDGNTFSLKLRNAEKADYNKWNIERVRDNQFNLTNGKKYIGLFLEDETNNQESGMRLFIYCNPTKTSERSKAISVKKKEGGKTYDIEINISKKTPCLKF